MNAILPSKASQSHTLFAVSIAVTLFMAVFYTILDVLQPTEWLTALLAGCGWG